MNNLLLYLSIYFTLDFLFNLRYAIILHMGTLACYQTSGQAVPYKMMA